MIDERKLEEIEALLEGTPALADASEVPAGIVLALVAEVRRLLRERLAYKASLVDQRWEIEEAARKPLQDEIAKLRSAGGDAVARVADAYGMNAGEIVRRCLEGDPPPASLNGGSGKRRQR